MIADICAKRDNVHFLNKTSLVLPAELPGIRILGCTLWAKTPAEHEEFIEMACSDYSVIFNNATEYSVNPDGSRVVSDGTPVTVKQMNAIHEEHVRWIEEEIKALQDSGSGERIVVLTHHAPTCANTIPIDERGEIRWINYTIF